MVSSSLAYKVSAPALGSEVVINDSPVKCCSIALSDVITRGKRLEASVFDVEAKQAWTRVAKCKYASVPLGGDNGIIKTAYYPGRFKRIYCGRENGEPFFLPSQISEVYPKSEKYISALATCDMKELKLKANTLLLTRSGTIGTVSFVSRTMLDKVFSDDVIRITFKNEYDLGFVYTFLRSSIGNKILSTNGYGSVITHLEPEHLVTIPIPNAPVDHKMKIHDLIVRSYKLRDESNELIDDATALLMKELNLPAANNFEADYYKKSVPVDTFSVKLSNLSGRLEASYHAPIVDAITAHLKKHAKEVTTIGDKRISTDVILPGRFKRVYVDNGYGVTFFGGRSIGELDPSDKKYLSFSQHDQKIKEELTIREGMILVTCSGTIGNIALVPRHWNNYAMTHDIIRLVPRSDLVGYTYIWLQTEYASKLLKAYSYGSVVTHIEKEHLEAVSIPLLNNCVVQKKINDLALTANEKRYEAYQLEQKALRTMEDEVINAK